VRGAPEAPVTIIEFIDFQSPYCRRVQPTLRRILDEYDGEVNLIVRDLPLRFHRYARLAAEAAECADDQNAFWKYHDVLLQSQDDLTRPALERYARRIDLDVDAFRGCLESGRFKEAVSTDEREAARLGVDSTPTFFINGRYLKGVHPYPVFKKHIDDALLSLGRIEVKAVEEKPVEKEKGYEDAETTDLPLTLVGTLVRRDASRSVATIREEGVESAGTYHSGEEVMDGVKLVKIERERVYLRDGADLEFLPLTRPKGGEPLPEVEEGAQEKSAEGPTEEEIAEAEATLPDPDVILTLSREEVTVGLEDRESLEQALEVGVLDVEGKRLLKIAEVPEGSLYEKLGLQPHDVLMRVNGEWVYEGHNPLWSALADAEGPVIVRVMRGGFPQTFEYEIE
jgi:predicted DsbA family dithiol-disulfide isomerase